MHRNRYIAGQVLLAAKPSKDSCAATRVNVGTTHDALRIRFAEEAHEQFIAGNARRDLRPHDQRGTINELRASRHDGRMNDSCSGRTCWFRVA